MQASKEGGSSSTGNRGSGASGGGLIPSVFGRWRSNGAGNGSGDSKADGADAELRQSLDEADSFIVRARQGANKVRGHLELALHAAIP